MNLTRNIEAIDLALYLKKQNTLIIADTHIGYEEALNKRGVFIPRFQFKEIVQRLEKILSKVKNLDKIIINGDIKHEFGTISDQEWRHTLQLLDFLAKHCNEIILVKGNHDKIIGPIANKRKVKVVDSYTIDDILILHGNKIPNLKNYKTIIIGHEHPAISLRDGPRIEKYKCFLKGKYKKKILIVQPSFNLVTEGTDILRNCYAISGTQKIPEEFLSVSKEKVLSPFLKQDLKNFNIYIVAKDKILDFGKLAINLTE
jgi:uncharacterized protein